MLTHGTCNDLSERYFMLSRAFVFFVMFKLSTPLFSQTISNGRYTIKNNHSGLVLDVAGKSFEDGANIQQWNSNGGTNQQFDVTYVGDGYYSIRAVHSGKSLDVYGYSSDAGAEIWQWTYNGTSNQLWAINPVGNGYYTITSMHSGLALDLWEWSTEAGGDIRQWTVTGAVNQLWSFTLAGSDQSSGVDGFASQWGSDGLSTTTGGAGASPITVYSCESLVSALGSSSAAVVQIFNGTIDCRQANQIQVACAIQCPNSSETFYRVPVGTQTCTELGSSTDSTVNRTRNETRINVASNKTIIGLGTDSKVLGATFNLSNSSNIIMRNFTIEDVNPALVEAGDAITLSNSSHIWIDHMRTYLISDGNVDINDSQNVTLSWNHFVGWNSAVCGNRHYYTNGVVASQVTFHHNYWENAAGRNPKLDGSATRAHIYNNYWLNVSYFSVSVNTGAQGLVEANYFNNSLRPHWNNGGYLDASISSNRYSGVSASDSYRHTGDSVFGDVNMYSYTLDNVDQIPSIVVNNAGPK